MAGCYELCVTFFEFDVLLRFEGRWLVRVTLSRRGTLKATAKPPPSSTSDPVLEELKAYFLKGKDRPEYPYLRLDFGGFFGKCIRNLWKIPRGEVRTYGWLARVSGRPGAARAAGAALAKNPLPLFFPCHRVVAKRGLGGFSAGLDIKRLLLALEGAEVL